MTPKSAPPHIAALATLQFSASLWIVARHYSYFLHDDFPHIHDALSGVTFTDLFFVLSGFFLQYINGRKDRVLTGSLIWKQLGKLYPLHLLTMGFFVAILTLQTLHLLGSMQSRSGWECVLPHATLLHAWGLLGQHCLNYPSWFLSALFAMYLAYPLIHMTIRRFGPVYIVAVLAAVTLAYEVAYRFGGAPHWTTLTYNFGVLRGIPTFLSGVLIAYYLPSFRHRIQSFLPAYIAYAFSLIGMMTDSDPLLFYAVAQIALVALVAGAEANGISGILMHPRLSALGRYSFPLYLLHVPVATAVMTFLFVRVLHLEGVALIPALIATAAIAIAAAIVFETGLKALRQARSSNRRTAGEGLGT